MGALGIVILSTSERINSLFALGCSPSEAITEGRGRRPSSGVSQSTCNSVMR